MSTSSESRPSFAEYFAATMTERGESASAKADVSIERGAELIRADRDGRAPTPE